MESLDFTVTDRVIRALWARFTEEGDAEFTVAPEGYQPFGDWIQVMSFVGTYDWLESRLVRPG